MKKYLPYIFISIAILTLSAGLYFNINAVQELRVLIAEPPPAQAVSVPPSVVTEPAVVEKNHESHIVKIEAEVGGLNLSRVAKHIQRDEGVRKLPYLDTTGHVTIGVGRSLATNGISATELLAIIPKPNIKVILSETELKNSRIYIKQIDTARQIFQNPLTEHDITLLLTDDLKNTTSEAVSVFGAMWETLSDARKEAIVDVLFNLGLPNFKKFVNFIEAIKNGDYKAASDALLLSAAARQNVLRYNRNANVIRTGDARYFQLE